MRQTLPNSLRQSLHPLLIALLALAMFNYPQDVLTSASAGVSLWWKFVLPALLPFFILSELLIGAGFVHFLGVLLEPLMRPLFHLPGKAAFVVAMGYTSGFPMGAVLTARLRQDREITQEEGERLLTFTNNPSPGFIFGAVASGLLGKPELGILLALSVYLANLLVGILFRFYGSNLTVREKPQTSLRKAWRALLSAQAKDDRPFGLIFGQAIRQSVTTVITVGGYIVFFSVALRVLTLWHITALLANALHLILGAFLPLANLKALLDGLLEMTLGCQGVVAASSNLNAQIAGLAFVMGWGGFSVFAQIAGFTAETDLRISPYILGRVIHAFLSLGLSELMLRFAHIPTFSQSPIPTGFNPSPATTPELWLNTLHLSTWMFIGTISTFLLLLVVGKVLAFRRR